MAAARSSKFLRLLDAAYASHNVLKVIFDNHSAHICKKINFYSPSNRRGRFEFTFALKHGSWLNMVKSLTCSILRQIRVMPKQKFRDCTIDGYGMRQLVSGGSRLVL